MANYISVPRDFSKVKSKVFFNLTKRQLICFSLGAMIGVPTFFLIKRFGNVTVATLGMMITMMKASSVGSRNSISVSFLFALLDKCSPP